MDLKHRAAIANVQGIGPFTLRFAGFSVKHEDVRALLILARALQAEESSWLILDAYDAHWSAWVPGMTKQDIPEF
jgi:hypothetical protein